MTAVSLTNQSCALGRFAPSPTGPLHLGSLTTALASFLSARASGGQWRVRIDDLDPPRCISGMADTHLRVLERLGLMWDGEVVYQSARIERYRAAVDALLAQGAAFHCGCTRKSLGFGPYPGTCAHGLPPDKSPRSVRAHARASVIRYSDPIQGTMVVPLVDVEGDFVIRRADGLFGYHLACVCDDIDMGITEVVRGSDLMQASANQMLLFDRLERPRPGYAHIPTVTDATGNKLSKHTHAPDIEELGLARAMHSALTGLGQTPDPALADAPPETQLLAAIERFRPLAIPHVASREAPHWALGS